MPGERYFLGLLLGCHGLHLPPIANSHPPLSALSAPRQRTNVNLEQCPAVGNSKPQALNHPHFVPFHPTTREPRPTERAFSPIVHATCYYPPNPGENLFFYTLWALASRHDITNTWPTSTALRSSCSSHPEGPAKPTNSAPATPLTDCWVFFALTPT